MTTGEKARLVGLCRIEIKRWKVASESNHNMRYMVNLMEIALGALTAEPVAWQFYDDGGWHNGSNHNNHRENTVNAGYRIRELYPEQHPSPEIPNGWRLVPVEPTQKMVDAHMNGVVSGGFQCGYRAMLAAAPTP